MELDHRANRVSAYALDELLDQRSRASGKSIDDLRKEATAKDGIRRIGKPEDIAALTLFLCSERASYITGVSLNLDGGRLKGLW